MENESSDELLEAEVSFAKKVESSYKSWLSDYFAKERLASFNKFCDRHLDTTLLDSIRNRQLALEAIEEDMLIYIEAGKLASMAIASAQEQDRNK